MIEQKRVKAIKLKL